MLAFEYEKRGGVYWIEGKTKPCSSKTKMMVYISREICKQLPDKGKITMGEVNNEIAK